MMAKKIIYFLCTGNSCRSQMAEGWAKKYLDDKWEVHCAGIEAHGLNNRAIKVMKEVDVDISKHTSNIINFDILNQTDLVVTLCSEDRKSTRLNSSHVAISYAVFCLKQKTDSSIRESPSIGPRE